MRNLMQADLEEDCVCRSEVGEVPHDSPRGMRGERDRDSIPVQDECEDGCQREGSKRANHSSSYGT